MYNIKPLACLLILAAFSNFVQSQTTVVARRDDFCGDDFTEIDKTLNQFESLREKRDNIFYEKHEEVFDYYADDDIKQLFNAFLPWAILLLVLMGFCLISVIVFIVLACGKYKKEDNRTGVYTTFGCVLFWLFVGCFATIIVFIGKSTHRFDRVRCSLYDIPATLLGGVDNTNEKFMGLRNLQTILSSFRDNLNEMPGLSDSFNTIFTTDSPSSTNFAWSGLTNFVETYRSARIQNGEGSISRPNTVLMMTPSVSEMIGSDFTKIDLTAQRLQLTAEEGRRYQDDSYRNNVDAALDAASTKLTSLISELNGIFEPMADNADTAIDYASIGYWVLFGLCCAAFLLGFIIVTVLCCISTWQRCAKGLVVSRVFLVLLGIITICTAVATFIIMIGSVSGSSFCGFIGEINRGNFNVFNEINQQVSSDVIELFEACSDSSRGGDLGAVLLTSAVEREAFNSVNTFFDGLLSYNNYNNLYNNSDGSPGIEAQVSEWELYENGQKSNFAQVDQSLENLNELIDCADQIFFLTADLCIDVDKECFGILETDAYTVPACVSNVTQANTHFNDLKAYMTEVEALKTNMIRDLSDTTIDSPEARYIEAKGVLNDLLSPYTTISNAVSTALGVATGYNAPQSELIDCRAFRRSLLNFEYEGCFAYNFYVYIILVFGAISSVLLFFLTWCLCCGLRETGSFEEVSVIEDPYMDKNVVKEVGDVLDFEEREIIPNY